MPFFVIQMHFVEFRRTRPWICISVLLESVSFVKTLRGRGSGLMPSLMGQWGGNRCTKPKHGARGHLICLPKTAQWHSWQDSFINKGQIPRPGGASVTLPSEPTAAPSPVCPRAAGSLWSEDSRAPAVATGCESSSRGCCLCFCCGCSNCCCFDCGYIAVAMSVANGYCYCCRCNISCGCDCDWLANLYSREIVYWLCVKTSIILKIKTSKTSEKSELRPAVKTHCALCKIILEPFYS